MKIQLPVRWLEKKLIDEELRNLNKLINGEDSPESEQVDYTYGRIVIDTKDIKSFNELDKDNTILRTYTPESYCIAIPFEDFSRIFSELSGEMITKIERKETKKTKKAPIKKDTKQLPPPPISGEDEDFLK